jgi:hypothetical protein
LDSSHSRDVAVLAFGPRMVCTRCGIAGHYPATPGDQPPRESLTGVRWNVKGEAPDLKGRGVGGTLP